MVALVTAAGGACATYRPPADLAYARTTITSGGRRIAVERFAPLGAGAGAAGAAGVRRPAVLVLHSSAGIGAKTGAETRRWADGLARRGFVAYVVHYFDRTGQRHTDDPTEARLWPVWTATLGDAFTALRQDAEVDSTRTGVVGISLGGYLALAFGAADPRPDALVIVSGGFFPGVAAQIDALRSGAAPRRFPPTLLLHGTADGAVPFREAQRVERVLTRAGAVHWLVPFPGEDHLLAPVSRPRATALAAQFLDDPRAFDLRAFDARALDLRAAP